jgi:hypothetical protein
MADYTDYSPTVLYDVFYEAGTQLGGRLAALERQDRDADPFRATAWRDERRNMRREREAIGVDDRDAQIAAIERWNARRAALSGHGRPSRHSDSSLGA